MFRGPKLEGYAFANFEIRKRALKKIRAKKMLRKMKLVRSVCCTYFSAQILVRKGNEKLET